MPWDFILLPLLGGFWFSSLYYRSRFRTMQANQNLLLFYAATSGIFLALLARVITFSLVYFYPNESTAIKSSFFPWPYAATAFLAFILGPLVALFLNFFSDKETVNKKAIRRYGDPLERILLQAQEDNKLVAFTLKSGKVYVGLIHEVPANLEGPCPWFIIVPVFSGYRDSNSKQMHLDTDYIDVLIEFAKEEASSGVKFQRVIRVDEIESCGQFDVGVWERFNQTQNAVPS